MLRRTTAQTIDPEGPLPDDRPTPDTPERRLLRAILRGATVELRYADRRVRADALDWFHREGDAWGTVEFVCDVLGLDVGRLRRLAAKIVRRR